MVGEPVNLALAREGDGDRRLLPGSHHADAELLRHEVDRDCRWHAIKNTYIGTAFIPFEKRVAEQGDAGLPRHHEAVQPERKGRHPRGTGHVGPPAVRTGGDGMRIEPHSSVPARQGQDGHDMDRRRTAREDRPGDQRRDHCFLLLQASTSGFSYQQQTTAPNKGMFNCDAKNSLALNGNSSGVAAQPPPVADRSGQVPHPHDCRAVHRGHLRGSRRAAWCSPTRPLACSTSRTVRSACSARSRTGSCTCRWATRRGSRSSRCSSSSPRRSVSCSNSGIMRRLQGTSEATQLVVTVSLLAACTRSRAMAVAERRGPSGGALLGGNKISVGPVNVTWHSAFAFGIAIAIAIGLRLLLYRTRAGITMRADGRRPTVGHAQRRQARPLGAPGVGHRVLARGARRHARRSRPGVVAGARTCSSSTRTPRPSSGGCGVCRSRSSARSSSVSLTRTARATSTCRTTTSTASPRPSRSSSSSSR